MKKVLFLFMSILWIACHVQAQISAVQLKNSLDASAQNGTLNLQVQLAEQKYKATRLSYTLKDPSNQIVAQATLPIAKKQRTFSFKPQTIHQPVLWNAETPALYTLEISLHQKNGTQLDRCQRSIAFRHLEMTENKMLVNGKEVRIKGVNLRSLANLTEPQELKKHIEQWKQHHVNAIRISETPKNTDLYALCDQFGIYVLNEEMYSPTHPALREGCLWDWPNQDLPVKMEEMKKLYQDIRFFDFDRETGSISLQNLHTFTNLNQFDFYYLIRDHGQEIHRGQLKDIAAAPGETVVYKGLKGIQLERNTTGDVRIEFYATRRNSSPFQPQGSLVAREQTYIHTFFRPIQPENLSKIRLDKITENQETVTFEGNDLQLVFNKQSGLLTSYRSFGEEYLHQAQGLHPFFWRAPTYTDRLAHFPEVLKAWKEASYQPVKADSFCCKQKTNDPKEMAVIQVSYRFPQTNATWQITYKIRKDGVIKVDNQFVAESVQTPMIPRVGLRWQLNPAFTTVHYFGRGPRTNYRDCRTAQFLGEYASDIQDTQEVYQPLQENGHRTDIYWCALQGNLQGGLLLVADRTFEMNLSRNLLEDMEKGIHQTQNAVDFFVDYRMMGIGADNRPGTPVQEPYLIRPGKENVINYGFTIVPFSKTEDYKKYILKY